MCDGTKPNIGHFRKSFIIVHYNKKINNVRWYLESYSRASSHRIVLFLGTASLQMINFRNDLESMCDVPNLCWTLTLFEQTLSPSIILSEL